MAPQLKGRLSYVLIVFLSLAAICAYYYYQINFLRNQSFIQTTPGTCSRKSERRGPHQRVISYSLYGNLDDPYIIQRYLEPLIDNIKNIADLYPGWIVRIHHNSTDDPRELENLFPLGAGDHVDFCNVTSIIRDLTLSNIFAMTWRWLPLLDNSVDVMMSRDADSYIIDRELAAVQEWMSSKDHTFHVMRDNRDHCNEMMGGMWGVKLNRNRTAIKQAAQDMLTGINHIHVRDFDQQLLKKIIWPLAHYDVMEHDSYCCSSFKSARPFPTRRKGKEFVGMIGQPKPWDLTCPVQCRGSHAEWIDC